MQVSYHGGLRPLRPSTAINGSPGFTGESLQCLGLIRATFLKFRSMQYAGIFTRDSGLSLGHQGLDGSLETVLARFLICQIKPRCFTM